MSSRKTDQGFLSLLHLQVKKYKRIVDILLHILSYFQLAILDIGGVELYRKICVQTINGATDSELKGEISEFLHCKTCGHCGIIDTTDLDELKSICVKNRI